MSVPMRARKFVSRLSVEALEDRTNPTAILTENLSSFAADRVLVTLDSPAHAGALDASPLAQSVQRLGGTAFSVTLKSGVSVGQAVTAFSGTAGVAFAEPDYAIGGQTVPNDPGFASEWGLNNANDADIDAPEAWDTAHGTGAHIVAIIDTGVQYTHPDLAQNIWTNTGEVAGNGIDDDGDGYVDDVHGYDFANNDGDPMDDNGHGTHVAGTIGAVGNNGIGVTGVAWTTQIMALKFLGSNGSGSTSGAVSAIYYAVDHGAKVLNNSWGGGGYSQSLYDAISYANTHGVIFVAAAGNAGSNNDTTANYPSNYALPNVVAVAATTNTDALASYSNYGATQVDLGAPGSGVYSTYLNGGYATLSGTSMATPHVTGALAVYWDANSGATAAQVIQRLKDSVDPLAALQGKTVTGGRLNLNKMLSGAGGGGGGGTVSGPKVLTGAFSGADATSFNKVRLTFDKAIDATSFDAGQDIVLTGPTGARLTATLTPVSGTVFDVTFAKQSAYGNYTITVGPNLKDTAGYLMNQDGDGTNGEPTQDQFVGVASLSPPFQTFGYTSTAQVAIRDRATVTSSMTIPTVAGRTNVPISDVNVTVNLTHTWDSDLQLTLIAPNGKSVLLFNRRGGSGDNLTNTVFNDEATTAIAAGAAPFTGSFKPEALLSLLDGQNAAGTWKLQIADLAAGDVGKLLSFTLTFTTGTPPTGQGMSVFSFRDADPNAPQVLKGDSAAAEVALLPAPPVQPSVTVTAATADPQANDRPAAAPPVTANPIVTTGTPATVVAGSDPVGPVDGLSLAGLFPPRDIFAPFRL